MGKVSVMIPMRDSAATRQDSKISWILKEEKENNDFEN